MAKPYNLKINLLSQPFGVEKEALTFSFAMGEEEENILLTSARFVFAKTVGQLEQEQYLFDSDFVATQSGCGISLCGLDCVLQADECYACRVQTKSNQETVSDWSEPLVFSTAPANWNPDGVWANTECAFCLLRKEFSLAEIPQKALLQVTARSPEPSRQYVYHVTVNGSFVGLGPARYDKADGQEVLYYETIDVTHCLKQGVNCLGAACYTLKEQQFAARLVLFDENGQKTVVFDDATEFEAMDATTVYRPEQSIGTNYFLAHGENIDGEIYPYGWDEPFYQSDAFVPAANQGSLVQTGLLKPYPAPVVQRYFFPALLCEVLEDGTWFIDLGKEIVGGISLTANLPRSVDVTLRFGEELTDEGRVKYAMRTSNKYEEHWKLASGNETLTSIGMKTFRYVEIAGLPEEASVTVQGSAYQVEFDQSDSYFTSSSELLNTIYDLCKYTIQATNQNLYVDSQSRERCAYEGDVLINMLTAAGVQDCNALSRFSVAYLLTHRTWPTEYVLYCILMARADYDYTGDASLLMRRYDELTKNLYLEYLNPQLGLIRNVTMAGNVMDAVLVDWPMSERDGYDYQNALYNTVFNAIHYRALADLSYIAGVVGKTEDQIRYQTLAENLKQAMIDRLYDEKRGCFIDGLSDEGTPLTHAAQHATAFALYAGVYDSWDMQQSMANYLADQGEIRMSVYGAHFLLEGLYQAGAGQAANALLLNDDVSEGARTWAYMLDKLDATITTEAWNTTNKPNMTWSHPWGSAAGAAIVRGLFGIKPLVPGFKEFSVDLQPFGLRYAAIQVPTVKGKITAAFDVTKQDCAVCLTVKVPANTVAHLSVPGKAGCQVKANGNTISADYQNGRYQWQMGSGEWLFEIGE